MLVNIWNMLILSVKNDVGKVVSVPSGHGKIREGSEGRNESSQDVEESLLLDGCELTYSRNRQCYNLQLGLSMPLQ